MEKEKEAARKNTEQEEYIRAKGRDEFLREIGIFQGRFKEEGQFFQQSMIEDRIQKQTELGVADIFEALTVKTAELDALKYSMFVQKTTQMDAQRVWQRLALLFGEPGNPAGPGDWSKGIIENIKKLRRELEERIFESCERFYKKPTLGISGVRKILDAAIEVIDEAVQDGADITMPSNRYIAYYEQIKSSYDRIMKEQKKEFETNIAAAANAAEGMMFGVGKDQKKT